MSDAATVAAARARAEWVRALVLMTAGEVAREVEQMLLDAMDACEQSSVETRIVAAHKVFVTSGLR